MPGAPDPLYVAARRVLLDALEAFRDHLDAIVLVGAQAVYMHTGEADLAVAPFTTDGDLAIDPDRLRPEPLLEDALVGAGFAQEPNVVGIWQRSVEVAGVQRMVGVDLLVPASLGGAGRRGARIPPHGRQVARKVVGLEATLVDKNPREITSLEPSDERRFEMSVAGPAGLLVAKVHKIGERVELPDRLSDKDALDVYRLLRVVPTDELVLRFRTLRSSSLSREATGSAITRLPQLFGSPRAPGCLMAVRAAGVLVNSDTLAASLVVLTEDLLRGL
jgi:hypothetical protein